MKDEEILKDLSEEILVDMDTWNKSNPNATFLEIEEKARELASKLEVALIEKTALEREEESWKKKEEKERSRCPKCHTLLVSRGKRMRSLQGAQGREIKLKRTYGTCPNCGVGFFPPR
jgi:ribosomal protein S27AE